MNRIKVQSVMNIYEIDGKDTSGLELPKLTVASHWNRNNFVVLEVGGKRYTVEASDLRAAIQNATNTR